MPILYLTESEVQQVLTMELALSAVEAAFRKLSLDEAVNIPRQRCQTDHVMLHVLPAAAKTLNALGFKAYTTSKSGSKFHVYLFDPRQGGLIAILEADYLGQMRTGAASGVATKKLARTDASSLGLYGTGKQARTQLEAICKVRNLSRVNVYSRDENNRKQFAQEMTDHCDVEVVPVSSPEEAALGMQIITTATTSREPVLRGEWIGPGTHLNIIGSNFLAKSEVDSAVFQKAHLITVDNKDQAKMEAGEFVVPVREGVFSWAAVFEFAHVLTGRYPGRGTPEEVTVFKSLGLGIEDIAVGVKVVELARHHGIGRELPI